MPHSLSPKVPSLTFEPNFNISEMEDLEGEKMTSPEKEDELSSNSSCSFAFSYPSTSCSPTSSPVKIVAQEEEVEVEEEEDKGPKELEQEEQQGWEKKQEDEGNQAQMREEEQIEEENQDMRTGFVLSLPQSPVSSDLSSVSCKAGDSCSIQEINEGSLHMSTDSHYTVSVDAKVTDLVQFIILKYRLKEPLITKAEMLEVVIDGVEHFPVIFKKASKILEVICGIDMKEVDSSTHSYVLFNSLRLCYDGILSNKQDMPKNGLLIIVLGVIFINGNCALEEDMWNFLNIIGVCAGQSHFVYGEPRQLLTRVWVQEKYLEYQQVPNSAPACYEFLWGTRASAEINKMEVMEFLVKIKMTDPASFLFWYQQAIREEEMKIRNRVSPRDSTTATRIAHLSESPAPTEE